MPENKKSAPSREMVGAFANNLHMNHYYSYLFSICRANP